jgi:hypothetical protein
MVSSMLKQALEWKRRMFGQQKVTFDRFSPILERPCVPALLPLVLLLVDLLASLALAGFFFLDLADYFPELVECGCEGNNCDQPYYDVGRSKGTPS